ncbi:hypothetical protein E2562_024014 [Oryza meyeriana var. granulata]|uniref:Uncharacterized protein n=1 Tax=Oryza meyeriana var. granulata TaxID=110450 RepID=A0A6G1EDP3_9ORYZ|nr:hypothetical protein E2562_024014 [Oryza meyeriana var. granulata]
MAKAATVLGPDVMAAVGERCCMAAEAGMIAQGDSTEATVVPTPRWAASVVGSCSQREERRDER